MDDHAALVLFNARKAFAAVVGAEHTIGNHEFLKQVETATFETHQRVPFVVRPGSTQQVQQCLRIANDFGLPLYPISGGTNWGYGSRVPRTDGSVILELNRMDRIVAFDEDLAYVTVEPGVTQRKLDEFLRARGSKLWLDPNAISPDSSLIGSIVERGHGLTPYADHVATASGLEVVLPSGEVLHTGYGGFTGTAVGALDKWGIGPSLDGLFSQSNLGIVTQATLWLMPAPADFRLLVWEMDSHEAMERSVDALRPIRLSGLLKTGPRWTNEYRLIESLLPYPWDLTGGKTPLDEVTAQQVARDAGIPLWTGYQGLYGSHGETEAQRDEVTRALNAAGLTPSVLDASVLSRESGPWSHQVIKNTFRTMSGKIPSERPFSRPYWRHRNPKRTGDYDRDGCGILWVTAVAPLAGRHLRAVSDITRRVLLRNGFEPDLCGDNMRERVLHFHISIMYDRSVEGEDARALACHEEVLRELRQAGYPAQRVGINAMGFSVSDEPAHRRVLQALKAALDPNGVLAPGRYDGT